MDTVMTRRQIEILEKINLLSGRSQQQTEVGECLMSFNSENSTPFLYPVNKSKEQNIENYNFFRCFALL
jgi:hypothetical protein